MSVLRYDAATADWVIFAPSRRLRPQTAERRDASPAAPPPSQLCPFCPGNEALTPPEVFAVRDRSEPNTPGWKVRVVPNKFPALRIEEEHRRISEGETLRFMGGCGAHEVVIDSPEHDAFLGAQPVEQVELLLRTLQARYNDLMRDPRMQSVVVFKNHGERAGTSLRHPHCQVIAMTVVPRLLRVKQQVATEYFDTTGRCIYCVLRDEELADGRRVLAANDRYAAVLPYASHVPFEVAVFPLRHRASFGDAPVEDLHPLAELLKTVLLKLYAGLENPDFNLTIDTVPRGDEDKEYFLWHIRILPRLTTPAGFELGTGMAINTVMPEDATEFLRAVPLP